MSEHDEAQGAWHAVGAARSFSARRGTPRRAAGKRLAIYRLDDLFFAIDERCPHAGASLCGGTFKGLLATCPRHRWQFNVRTGACLTNEIFTIRTYPTRVHKGQVQVLLPSRKETEQDDSEP